MWLVLYWIMLLALCSFSVSMCIKSADKLEQDIAGARRVILSETHHMPNMEKPEEFNRIVYDFLKSLK